jgi:hypothetical protein
MFSATMPHSLVEQTLCWPTMLARPVAAPKKDPATTAVSAANTFKHMRHGGKKRSFFFANEWPRFVKTTPRLSLSLSSYILSLFIYLLFLNIFYV